MLPLFPGEVHFAENKAGVHSRTPKSRHYLRDRVSLVAEVGPTSAGACRPDVRLRVCSPLGAEVGPTSATKSPDHATGIPTVLSYPKNPSAALGGQTRLRAPGAGGPRRT